MKQIYIIRNLLNEKVYVGQATSAYDRFRRHRNNHLSADKQNLELIKAMKELGADNFYYTILENCDDEVADEREMYYIQKYGSFKNGYNRTMGGSGNQTIAQEDIDECCRLFEDGLTILEIESRTSVNHKLIKKELEKIYPDYGEITRRNTARARDKSKSIPVEQYDLDGNYIRTYVSARNALESLGKPIGASGISRCCKGIDKTAYGYIWKYGTR